MSIEQRDQAAANTVSAAILTSLRVSRTVELTRTAAVEGALILRAEDQADIHTPDGVLTEFWGADEEGDEWKVRLSARFTAEGRETSPEILDAILAVAQGDHAQADRIWSAPAERELLAIWERVTKNGTVPASDFVWGAAGDRWAVDITGVTVYLPEDCTPEQEARANEIVREAMLWDANWNGADVKVQRGEQACVWADGPESVHLTALVRQVQSVFDPSEA